MTTVSYTTEANVESGYVKVEWANMSPGDDGQPFNCSGLVVGTIHYFGDFNGGSGKITIMGSNQITPTDFGEFAYSYAPRIQTPPDGPRFVGAVKPVADANMVGGGVAIIFVQRED